MNNSEAGKVLKRETLAEYLQIHREDSIALIINYPLNLR